MKAITVAELCERYSGTDEFAVIDPREEGIFTRGHLLGASNIPLSRMELLIGKTVPHKATEIILTGDGDDTIKRAATVLSGLGYTNLHILSGGLAAWVLCGYHLFSGVNLIGKAFGEFLEHDSETPSINAEDLHRRKEAGENIYLLDGRTPTEHSDFCIPGALSCPNGELVFRAVPIIPEDATVVVHCASRTRSILGAQTLIDAGVSNPVVALENGTIDWQFAGLDLEHGAKRPLAHPGDADARAVSAAKALAQKTEVCQITIGELGSLRQDTDVTLYLYDVRSRKEFAAGHVEGARNVPGGQLVQNVDRYVVTRNARTVLIDDDGVRARASAYWLTRMGFQNVFTLTTDETVQEKKSAPHIPENSIPIGELHDHSRLVIADIRRSVAYRRGHLPGAWYLSRARLEQDARNLPDGKIALISEDGAYAELVAQDLQALGSVSGPRFRFHGRLDRIRRIARNRPHCARQRPR